MTPNQFSLPLNQDITIHGDYEGNREAGRALIMVHGFGAKRDSRGMFVELGDRLKDELLVVRFDLNQLTPDSPDTKIFSLSTQAEMLSKVWEFVQREFDQPSISVVAHSQGCLVTAMADIPETERIVLCCSPTSSMYQRMKEHFGKRAGTHFDETGESVIVRSDKSLTYIPAEYWPEVKSIKPLELFGSLKETHPDTWFVRGLDDEVVQETNYAQVQALFADKYVALPGDHNFTGSTRAGWVQAAAELLS